MIILSILLIGLACHARGEDEKIWLYAQMRRSGETNEFWLPVSRLKRLPRWDPLHQKPPVSLTKAIQTASKWLAAREGGGERGVDEITICSLHSDEQQFWHFFYYRFIFNTRPFDQAACIVLMDGTVLEPEPPPSESTPARQKHK